MGSKNKFLYQPQGLASLVNIYLCRRKLFIFGKKEFFYFFGKKIK